MISCLVVLLKYTYYYSYMYFSYGHRPPILDAALKGSIAIHCENSSLTYAYWKQLKRGYIEFKYYADAIHSGITPPG